MRVGVHGPGEQFVGAGLFDDLPQVHDSGVVADVPDHRQVMGDEQIGEAEPVLQLLEEVEHLRLDGHIEGRDRLVEDQETRIESQGTRHADTLTLPAGELVGIAVRRVGIHPHQRQQLSHPLRPIRPRHVGVHMQEFADGGPPPTCAGLREANGSWNTICMWRRNSRSCLRSAAMTSIRSELPPSNRRRSTTSPEVGSIRRRMLRAVVDLPHPDSPTRPRVLPDRMSKDRPATAETSPFSPPKTPPPTLKVLTRSRTESAASLSVTVGCPWARRFACADHSTPLPPRVASLLSVA